ncbi:unnamed protein product [Periconia digitata]|uniref:MARVEL domain-containing protein n=1 Tax=Periconia digitata TaxID=1303443 RepID=A0A9W4UA35_9PLEO|nr:unnamed protein product [Periconia digitata]
MSQRPQVSPVMESAQPARAAEAGPSTTAPSHPATTHQQTTTTSTTETAPAHPNIVPASISSTFAPTGTTAQAEPLTLNDQLNAADRKWKWKIGMRIIIVLVSIIGMGCVAWIVANFTTSAKYKYFDWDTDDQFLIPWLLITFVLSIIWSSACIAVFFMRKTHEPMVPGAQVGIDLILWLAYVGTALCAVAATMSVASWGNSGQIGGRYSYSSYNEGPWSYSAGNNSWTYSPESSSSSSDSYYGSWTDSSSSSSSSERSCNGSSSSSYSYRSYEVYPFSGCEDIDAYVNTLWQTKGARFNSELTACVCQFIALFLHLTLFVWACVDTHRRRKGKTGKDAEKLAAEIIQNMIKTGAVVPPPNQAHMRPMGQPMPHGFQQNQQYPQYPQYQVPHSHPVQQAPQTQAPQPASRIPPHEQSALVS